MMDSQKTSWKEVGQELKRFVMRDLQDYRLADYMSLSRKSRYLLLGLFSPLLALLFFFLWRYAFGTQWLSQVDIQREALDKQVVGITETIEEYRQFLAREELLLFSDIDSQENEHYDEKKALTETELVKEVESLVFESQLHLMKLFPKRETMMIEHLFPDKKSNARRMKLSGFNDLLTQLKPLSEAVKVRALHLKDRGRADELLLIPKLEVDLEVCGEYSQLLNFLAKTQHRVSQFSTILYLESLAIDESPEECSTISYQLTLQFYDENVIHQAYVLLGDNSQISALVPEFPKTLAQVISYIERFNPTEKIDIQKLVEIDDFQTVMASLFQEEGIRESLKEYRFSTDSAKESANRVILEIGATYRGIFLAGIIIRDSGSFAIIKMPTGKWQTLQEGDRYVLEIMPEKIVIDYSLWELEK